MTQDAKVSYQFPSDWDIQLNFGQYKGKTPREIVEADENALGYLLWAIDTVHHYNPSSQFTEEVRRKYEELKHDQKVSGQMYPHYRGHTTLDHGTFDLDDDDDHIPGFDPDDDIPF